MTGEISIRGNVHPVGGVHAKINAAVTAGIEKVLIPEDNWQETFEDYSIKVIPVKNIDEVLKEVFNEAKDEVISKPDTSKVLTAQGI